MFPPSLTSEPCGTAQDKGVYFLVLTTHTLQTSCFHHPLLYRVLLGMSTIFRDLRGGNAAIFDPFVIPPHPSPYLIKKYSEQNKNNTKKQIKTAIYIDPFIDFNVLLFNKRPFTK